MFVLLLLMKSRLVNSRIASIKTIFSKCLSVRLFTTLYPIEDFAVGNVVGFIKNDAYYLVRHLNFNIYYNKKTGVYFNNL